MSLTQVTICSHDNGLRIPFDGKPDMHNECYEFLDGKVVMRFDSDWTPVDSMLGFDWYAFPVHPDIALVPMFEEG